MAISITVQALSRFEQAKAAYDDQVNHGYNPNYVNPLTRRIELESSTLPGTARSWEWRVVRRSDGRVFSKTHQLVFPVPAPKPSIGFNLPSEGRYDCQLIVTLANGQQEKSPIRSIDLRDFLIAVIGDSAAAGQGNPDTAGKPKEFGNNISGWDLFNPLEWVESARDAIGNWLKKTFTTLSRALGAKLAMDPAPGWLEKNVYRSLRSGVALAARAQENLRQGDVVTFLHFARSGSDIVAGLLGPRTKDGKKIDGWIGNIGQIEELKRTVGRRQIDALIISIGVNDVGFTGSLENLVKDDFGWGNDTTNRKAVLDKINRDIAGLDARFRMLADALSGLNVRQVYLTEYPTAIFDKVVNGQVVTAGGCEIFSANFDLDISPRDAQDLKDAAGKLNGKLRDVAGQHKWVYVSGIAAGFAGHGYCTAKQRFFVMAEESLAIQGDMEGTMHPNARGHHVIAREVGRELRKGLKTTTVVVNRPQRGTVTEDAVLEPQPAA